MSADAFLERGEEHAAPVGEQAGRLGLVEGVDPEALGILPPRTETRKRLRPLPFRPKKATRVSAGIEADRAPGHEIAR